MPEFVEVNQLDSVVPDYMTGFATRDLKNDQLTRDFLGLTGGGHGGNGGAVNVKDVLNFTGDVYEHHRQHSLLKSRQPFGFVGTTTAPVTWGNY